MLNLVDLHYASSRSIREAAVHLGLPEFTLRYDEKKAAASSHAGRSRYLAADSSSESLVQPKRYVRAEGT